MKRYSQLTKAALCVGKEEELFPVNGRPRQDVKNNLCPRCPVKDACLAHALEGAWQPWGTWGGLDQDEVRALWYERHPGNRSDADRAVGMR